MRVFGVSRPLQLRWHLVWLIVAAVVPVILFSGAMMFRVLEQERSALQKRLEEKAAQLAAEVDTELRRTIAALEVLGLSNALASGDLEAFHASARRVEAVQPAWANVQLLGPNGEHLVNARVPYGAPLPPLNRPDLPIEAARSRRALVSDMATAVVARRALTVVYVPVIQQEEVKYVLTAAIETPNWQKLLQSKLPSGMDAILVDRQSAVIATTVEGERFTGRAPERSLIAAVASEPAYSGRRIFDGLDAYAAYQTSAFSGWTVAALVPADAVESPVRALLGTLGGGFLMLLAVGLSLALVFASRIGRSMSQLVASIRAVGNGGAPLAVDGRIAEVQDAAKALTGAAALLAARLRREEAARSQVEAANRAKDDFLAMLGHELRNPLAPIRNAVHILHRAAPASEQAAAARSIIDRQTVHLARLVDDLLDLTRIERGRIELRRETVDLNALVRRTAQDYRGVASGSGLALQVELPESALIVHGDPTRLAQMVGNLLQNAVKFTPRGGQVSVSLARLAGQAEIRIRDTGAGIDPNFLERLFQPFVQGAQDMARSTGGLGLGLALVKGLAELHGGSVRGFSAGRGQGAEFVITLPLEAEACA